MAKPLSPAAQAVMDAFLANWEDEPRQQDRRCLAAAIRALAERTRPYIPTNLAAAPEHHRHWWLLGNRSAARTIKGQHLAIAAELEGVNG